MNIRLVVIVAVSLIVGCGIGAIYSRIEERALIEEVEILVDEHSRPVSVRFGNREGVIGRFSGTEFRYDWSSQSSGVRVIGAEKIEWRRGAQTSFSAWSIPPPEIRESIADQFTSIGEDQNRYLDLAKGFRKW